MAGREQDALAEFGLDADGPIQVPSLAQGSNAARRNEDVQALIRAWRTEVSSPEILQYEEDLVNELRSMLKSQDSNLERELDGLDNDEDDDNDDKASRAAILDMYTMEMERIKYSLARYLRTRILKIENSVHYLITSDHQDRLSDQEKDFLEKVNTINNNYFEDQITRNVASRPEYKKYLKPMKDDLVLNAEPDQDSYVFAMTHDDIDVRVGNQAVTMNAHGVYIMNFNSVREEVLDKKVFLM